MKLLYETIYSFVRIFRVPIAWVFGAKQDLLDALLDSGRISAGSAIDLGCGVGAEAIYLAQKGFEVTGVDFSPTAITMARDRARAAGVDVTFVKDDLTKLRHIGGSFDLLLDFGALNDLNREGRDAYVRNVLPLTHLRSRYVLMGFENKLPSAEVECRFGQHFNVETWKRVPESISSRTIAIF